MFQDKHYLISQQNYHFACLIEINVETIKNSFLTSSGLRSGLRLGLIVPVNVLP